MNALYMERDGLKRLLAVVQSQEHAAALIRGLDTMNIFPEGWDAVYEDEDQRRWLYVMDCWQEVT